MDNMCHVDREYGQYVSNRQSVYTVCTSDCASSSSTDLQEQNSHGPQDTDYLSHQAEPVLIGHIAFLRGGDRRDIVEINH